MEKDLYIYAHWNQYSKETEYQLSTYERSIGQGDVLLEKRSIGFDTHDDKKLRFMLSQALQMRLQVTRAEHQREQMEIQEEINTLLSLEYKPEEPAPNVPDPEDDIPF